MKLDKLLKFLGYRNNLLKERTSIIEKRIRNTMFVKLWIFVIFSICIGTFIITKTIMSLLLGFMSMSYMNSLHISQKQDEITLELRR